MRMPRNRLASRIGSDSEQAFKHRPDYPGRRPRLKQHAWRGILRADGARQARRGGGDHLHQTADHLLHVDMLAVPLCALGQRRVRRDVAFFPLSREFFEQRQRRRVVRAREIQNIRVTDERRAHVFQHILLHIFKALGAPAQIVDAKPRHRQHGRRERLVAGPEQRAMHERDKLRAFAFAANLQNLTGEGHAARQTAGGHLRLRAHADKRMQHFLHARRAAQRQKRFHRLCPSFAIQRGMLRQIAAQRAPAARQGANQPIGVELRPVDALFQRGAGHRRGAARHHPIDARTLFGEQGFGLFSQQRQRFLRLGAGGIAARNIQPHGCLPVCGQPQAVEQAAVDALALGIAKAIDALRQIGLKHAAVRVRAPDGVPRVPTVAGKERLLLLVVFADIAAKLCAVLAARGGGSQDIGAHSEGDLDHARRVFEVFNRQFDHAAAHAVGNKLTANDVQLLFLHTVMERGDDRMDFTGVGLCQRHVVDSQEEAVADLLFPGPEAAHFAWHGKAHIRKKAVLRADEHGAAARGDDRRIQPVITIDPIIAAHLSSSFWGSAPNPGRELSSLHLPLSIHCVDGLFHPNIFFLLSRSNK